MSEHILTHKHQAHKHHTHPHAASAWCIHCGVEVTQLSTNKQLSLSSFEVTTEEIADKEIGLWKLRTVPLPKTDDPLMERKLCGDKNVCPFLGRLARRVFSVPATSASTESLFSTAGKQMTKKRCGLTCDNLETLVYLHEVLFLVL
jgi:hypothetical protein